MNKHYYNEFKLLKKILFALYVKYGLTDDVFEFSKIIDSFFVNKKKFYL